MPEAGMQTDARGGRRRLAALVLGLVLAGAAVVAGLAWHAARGPLAGDQRHDFGVVRIDGDAASVSHRFALTNRTGETVTIAAARSSCGCTVAEIDEREIAPGATTHVDATLRLTASGRKDTTITLVLGDDTIEVLSLEAVGERTQRLGATRESLELAAGRSAALRLFLEQHDDETPPAPALEPPAGARAAFEGWTHHRRRDRAERRPALWRGRVTLERDGDSDGPVEGALVVRVGHDQVLRIDVRDARELREEPG